MLVSESQKLGARTIRRFCELIRVFRLAKVVNRRYYGALAGRAHVFISVAVASSCGAADDARRAKSPIVALCRFRRVADKHGQMLLSLLRPQLSEKALPSRE
jgi:hypothetical protein